MKVRSQIDWWVHIVFLIGIILAIIGVIQYSILAIVIIALLVLWCSTYFATTYTLTETELICQSGFFRQRIKYYNITTIQSIEHFSLAPALSTNRIAITQRNQVSKRAVLEISPQNQAFFLAELNEKLATAR